MKYVLVVFLGAVFGLLASTTIGTANATSCSCTAEYEPLTYAGVEELTAGSGDIAYEESRWNVESIGIAPLGVPSTLVELRTEGDSGIYVVAEVGGASE